MYLYIMNIKKYIIYNIIIYISIRELNLMVKYVTFNHCNMSSNLIALISIKLLIEGPFYIKINIPNVYLN